MPDDPRIDPLLDVIFDYDPLPTSSPLTHPVIRGSGDLVVEKSQPDKYFQRVEKLRISIPGQIVNNILSSAENASIRWNYVNLPTSTYLDSGIELGINPLTPATVAFELRILEGTFSESEINNSKVFGTSSSSAQQASQQSFPGPIVYEKFTNLSPPAEPIWLTKSSSAQVDLPNGVLEGGKSYTVVLRHLFWTQAFDAEETRFDHYLSQYSLATFSVNELPSVTNFRTNGMKNPTISSQDRIRLSFTVSDRDGPRTMYKVSVGALTRDGSSYIYSYSYASDYITHSETASSNIEIEHELPVLGLQAGIDYYWKVDLQDGLETVLAGDPADYFRINSLPNITSLKANGNEIILGEKPRIGNEDVEISWELEDNDLDDQEAYVLSLSAGGEEFLNTGIVKSNALSVVVPELPDGKEITVSLRVKDALEFGTEVTGKFVTNSSPKIVSLLVDNKVNPGNVASATPTFSWTFVDNNPSDIQAKFRIKVSTDDVFQDLVWDTGEVVGANDSVTYGTTGSPEVVPETLVHGVVYHVMVSVSDGISWSEYSIGFFSVNQAPGNPTLVSPSAGSYSGTVLVQWTPVTDPDGDEITYVLEVTDERAFDRGWELLAGPFSSSTTSYEMDLSKIPAGTNYGVRVVASDGFAESSPAVGGTSPRFEILNHPPTSPTITSPSDGDLVNKVLRIEWVESSPTDVDGDSVVYEIGISENSSEDPPIWKLVASVSEGKTRSLIDVSEYPDGTDYMVRIRAIDSRGEEGDFSYSPRFAVSNTVSISDFETLGDSLYVGSNDGRIFRARETIWQVDEDWSQQRGGSPFELFVRGSPQAEVTEGKLVISPVPGTTYFLRHSDK